jgi:hypothetical protein
MDQNNNSSLDQIQLQAFNYQPIHRIDIAPLQ